MWPAFALDAAQGPQRSVLLRTPRHHQTDLPDLKVSLDSLAVLDQTMRHFYIKAMAERSLGPQADWKTVDAAMVQAAALAEKIAALSQAGSRPPGRRPAQEADRRHPRRTD